LTQLIRKRQNQSATTFLAALLYSTDIAMRGGCRTRTLPSIRLRVFHLCYLVYTSF